MLRIPAAVTEHDDLIDDLMAVVHGLILADIGGGLTNKASTTSYTQAFDVMRTGMNEIRLPKWPVASITSVTTGTQGGASGTVMDSDSYYVTETGNLRLEGSKAYFPVGRQNVTVVWTAGIVASSQDELSLTLAERLTIAELFNTSPGLGKKSERIGGYAYTLAGRADRGESVYPIIAARIIDRYRSAFAFDPAQPG